jgi:DNA repair exonuclease SbcCD nuclease subunit
MYALYNQADIHLDTWPWTKRPEFKGDAYAALEASQEVIINDPAVPNDKKIVLWGGDITEKAYIDDATNACLANVMRKYREAGIFVAYINGNHDKSKEAYEGASGHPGIHGAFHLDTGSVHEIGGLLVVGLDWRPRTKLKEDIANVPPCDILVLHCAFKHLLGFDGSYDLEMDDIPAHVKNVLVGDVHVPDIRINQKGTVFVSPGPVHACAIDQAGPHGTMRMLTDGKNTWEFVPHVSRLVIDHTIPDIGIDALTVTIQQQVKQMVLKPHCVIRYTSEQAAEAETLFDRVKDIVHIHDKKTNIGHILTAEERREIIDNIEETSLLQELDRYPDSTGRDLVKLLLEAVDPGAVLVEEYNAVVAEGDKIPC